MTRSPVVAGQFYTANASRLRNEIEGYLVPDAKKINAIGCVSPHAGYMCSGAVAGAVLSRIKPRSVYLLLGPNHTGIGKRFGLDTGRKWLTPLGEVDIDTKLAEIILDNSKLIERDEACHSHEHSIEVEIPFLQVINQDFKFVPIVVSEGTLAEYTEIGNIIANAIKEYKKDITIIASSDMTHYEPHDTAKKKDRLAINKILDLDIEGFLKEIRVHEISMCGYAPTAIMMAASLKLGAKKGELIKYLTSGETCSDKSSVVGYAGIVVY